LAAFSSLERTVPLDRNAPRSRERIDGRSLGAEGGEDRDSGRGARDTTYEDLFHAQHPAAFSVLVFAILAGRNRFKPSIWPGAGPVM